MTDTRTRTYPALAERLVSLGMIPAAKAENALAEYGAAWQQAELKYGDLPAALTEFGVAVRAPADEVGDLEAGYRDLLDEAAACSGGPVIVSDVELIGDDDPVDFGDLHFKVNGAPAHWPVEHFGTECLDQAAIAEHINDLAPGGEDHRGFRALAEESGADPVYVLATAEQARTLGEEFGVPFA